VGGKVSLRVPFSLSQVDPHRSHDMAAAIIGGALFDTLFEQGEAGAVLPSLAEGEPEPEGANLRITLREGLRTGNGKPIDLRDVLFSLSRSRDAGGRVWLSDVPAPKLDGRSLLFATRDAKALLRALSSPLTAIVARDFNPDRPDGTGPFRVGSKDPSSLVLMRNAAAARGPGLLSEITLRASTSLDASLRAFEGGQDDIGWLGQGLYGTRPGSRAFDAGPVAYAVLQTGADASPWDVPGVAQRVASSIPHAKVASFGLGAAWPQETDDGWGGPATTLLVREDNPWLVELGRSVAALISRPSHEVVAKPVGPAELSQRRAARTFGLLLDVVRPFALGGLGAHAALLAYEDQNRGTELIKRPPKSDVPLRAALRGTRTGLLGEVHVQGGVMADLQLPMSPALPGIDWALSFRKR
jgi:peptide/nickel transport system substrate-binding protein